MPETKSGSYYGPVPKEAMNNLDRLCVGGSNDWLAGQSSSHGHGFGGDEKTKKGRREFPLSATAPDPEWQ